MARGCRREPAVGMGYPGDPQAPDAGQAEHAPHKMSTTIERHWLGFLASRLTRLTTPTSKGLGHQGHPAEASR